MTVSEAAPHRVLVVEDNPDVGELIAMAITALVDGVEAVRAENGLAAMRAIENDAPYDLILCDIMMPGLDGARLLRDLRAKEALAGLRVVLLTAVPRDQVPDLFEIPEVVGYLQKPVDPLQLAEEVRRHLGI